MEGSGANGFGGDWRKEGEEEGVSPGMEVSGSGRSDGDGGLIGAYVGRETLGVGRFLLGKVVSYDETTRVYRVIYEDGHQEDLERELVCKILRVDDGVGRLTQRKRRLDRVIPMGGLNRRNTRSRKGAPDVTASIVHATTEAVSVDADSSSDSCDHARVPGATTSSFSLETHVLPLELPPSSGDIAIPEGSISYLFSTYTFLRSFSLQLFLSPFGFDDYVGSLNCSVQNSLMDSIHLALMRALSRHLQMLSYEGSSVASKCLKFYDWTLLDMLTWPAFLAEYLFVMGYLKELESKEFINNILNGEYYCLTVATKLKILQLLCDDIISSGELRTELGMRIGMEEENEEGLDAYIPKQDTPTYLHHHEISKTSCLRYQIISRESVVLENQHVIPLVSEPDADVSANSQDKNSDECCLCGMDGTLICCDGCPSAYHSRCIGLNKAFLPEGLWFCPECNANKIGPTSSRIGKGASGAVLLGIDPHGRIFVVTCNYLIVLGASLNEKEPISRYYSHDDIPKILSVLSSTQENALTYAHISTGICEYFEIPMVSFKVENSDSMRSILANKDGAVCYFANTPSTVATNMLNNSGDSSVCNIMSYNSKHSIAKDDGTEYPAASSVKDHAGITDTQTVFRESHDIYAYKTFVTADENLIPFNNRNNVNGIVDPKIFLSKQIETRVIQGLGSVVTDMSCSNPAIPAEKSVFMNNVSFSSGNGSEIRKEEADSSICSTKNGSVGVCYESKHLLNMCDVAHKSTNDRGSTVPISFKSLYINQYIQGDIAASAAASLAVLSTKDNKFTSVHGSSNPKKIVSATIALQIKAFSVAVMNFLWPCAEKKLMDVPRERCGWCIACKGPAAKRGCLLNLAASNAIKGPARNCNLRASKHHENHLPVIAAQLLIMEESLRGLMIREFLDERYSEWRKQVREANSCSILKSLVLQLEKNIRRVAFSGGWTRMMDDFTENHKLSNGNPRTGGSQKRVGRRSKKQSELPLASSDDKCNDLQWWRGGKLSKVILQSGTIPSSLAKKAARQGGRKRISGISYHECSAYHRRSRQFAWRAAVEMCRSTSQLALQVRYLDAHIRWKEFTCSENVPMDIKGSETGVMAFRNSFICDKRISGNTILYAPNFGDQKHLPLRITKTVLQTEKAPDGNEKLWFSEDHLPLYLIKEYEEKVGACQVPLAVSTMHNIAKFYRRQLEVYWGDIFTYLTYKRENPGKCPFCQKYANLRYAVKCKGCEDYCHLDCSVPSVAKQNDDPTFSRMCKLCFSARSPAPLESSQRTCSRKSLLSGNNQLLSAPDMSSISETRPCSTSVLDCKMEVYSGSRSSNPTNSERKTKRSGGKWVTHGIVWRRKKHDSEAGKEFMMENILFKAKEGSYSLKTPICCLCKKPYNSNLMYVCCETCKNWCHADAVLLDETKILDVVGFKCCKCRRKSSPTCPYSAVDYVKLEETIKLDNTVDVGDDDMQIQPKSGSSISSLSNSETENFGMVDSNPFLHSFAKVEPVDEVVSDMEDDFDVSIQPSDGLQKLPLRTQVNQKEFDEWYAMRIGEYEASPESPQNILAPSTMNASWKLQSNSETENFDMVECDPLLHSFAKVEPIDETAFEMQDKFYASVQSSDGQQKLSARSHDNAVEISDKMQFQLKSGSSTTSLSNSETENFGKEEHDPPLHSFVNAQPSDAVARKMEDKFDASIQSTFGNQMLPIRRSLVSQNDFDEWYAMQTENPSYEASPESMQNILEANPRNCSWKMPSSLELDYINIDGHDNTDFENVYKGEHLSDEEVDIAGDMAFEPQTYFSFTELLESVDNVPLSSEEHQDVPITLNDYQVIYSDMPCHNLNRENGTIEKEGFDFEGLQCQKCKLYTPSPDLICDICSLCIHTHCSPWVEESTEDSTVSNWRCGNCREWR